MRELNTYLAGMLKQEFANDIGISGPYLSQLLKGVRTPSLRLAQKIAAHTEGAVSLDCWGK
ncbi:MAG: helix-turn-helix transcriptional regulator [Gammaproteobacteria bacterium]|nr:helix-turn-helix transcriptional regulator [Gammaproteobacteria bacterium]